MSDIIINLYLLSIILSPCVAFYYIKKKYLLYNLRKTKALILCFMISLIPVIAYIFIFFIFVGLEEAFNKSLVSEYMGRSFVICLMAGILVAILSVIAFAIYTFTHNKIKN